MDGQQYLNQISESTKPKTKTKKKGGFFTSKFFIIGAVGVGVLLLIILLGSIISGSKGDEKELDFRLKLHLDNTTEVIQQYQTDIKSSKLRDYSASLQGVLSNTSKELTDYLVEKYDFKDKNISKKTVEEYTLEKDGLSNELFEAKINGILDRIFAHKMAYEITVIKAEEARIINSTKNDKLKELLNKSSESLTNLYDKFNDFSETK